MIEDYKVYCFNDGCHTWIGARNVDEAKEVFKSETGFDDKYLNDEVEIEECNLDNEFEITTEDDYGELKTKTSWKNELEIWKAQLPCSIMCSEW
jgi:hypothetical protein